jgi:hypothetical protein
MNRPPSVGSVARWLAEDEQLFAEAMVTPASPSATGLQNTVGEPVLCSVPRAKVRVDQSTQARVALDSATTGSYAEVLRDGGTLPPPELVFDAASDTYWTADGHHRILAHDLWRGGLASYELNALVRPGTHRDAVLLAVRANHTHGLRRTNADKRRAVELVLADAE